MILLPTALHQTSSFFFDENLQELATENAESENNFKNVFIM